MAEGGHNAVMSPGKTLGAFANLVAEGRPTPGGGSVAAYAGVLAVSLGRMMCNLTIGKKKYAENEGQVKEINGELELLGARLQELIDEDARAFDQVLAAYKLPRNSDEEQQTRNGEITAATVKSIEIPAEVSERAFAVLRLLNKLAELGNPNVFPDITTGAQLAVVAIKGSYYNIAVNLKSLTGNEAVGEIGERTVKLIAEASELASAIETRTLKHIAD